MFFQAGQTFLEETFSPKADDLAAGVLVQIMLAAAEYAYEHWLGHRTRATLHQLTRQALELASGHKDWPG